jgi:hypothetical protein
LGRIDISYCADVPHEKLYETITLVVRLFHLTNSLLPKEEESCHFNYFAVPLLRNLPFSPSSVKYDERTFAFDPSPLPLHQYISQL